MAKGKGSVAEAPETFVKGDLQLKNTQYYQQELLEPTVKSGTQDEEDWVPFYKILKRFGLAEAIRRVKKKTILARRNPKDPSEWQFCLLKNVKFHTEQQSQTKQAKTKGKMDVAEWIKLKRHGMLGGSEEDEAEQVLADVTGKAESSKPGKQQLALQDKLDCSEEGESSSAPPKAKKSKKEKKEEQGVEAAMTDEVSAIEKPADKGTRVASKEVNKDLEKELETLKAMKPRKSLGSVKEKLIACA